MDKSKSNLYRGIVIGFIIFYMIQYLSDVNAGAITYPVIIDAVIFVVISLFYFLIYRKDNLLCFELFALPVAFVGLFYRDLIFPLVVSDMINLPIVSDKGITLKSADLQMIGYLVLIVGCSTANMIFSGKKSNNKVIDNVNYNIILTVLCVFLLALLVYDYRTGLFNSWFFYSNRDIMDVEDRNQGLGHITCLAVAITIIDVYRLSQTGVSNIWDYFKKSNKLCLFEWGIVTLLLLISGNRNEALLVMLPMVIAYSKCINKVKTGPLLLSLVAGVVIMAIIGRVRGEGVSSYGNATVDLFSLTRDFAVLGYNCDYLVHYTDQHGMAYFLGIIQLVLSGIPFIGPRILKAINLNLPPASADLCTNSIVTNSGMGTSLIGDLYYTAGFVWVVVFMFALGYYMSRLYYTKNLNIYLLVFYSYMVANALYYVRSSWGFPLTIIEYVWIIILIGRIFSKKKYQGNCL